MGDHKVTHETFVMTYARTLDGPRLAAWRCSCGAAELDLASTREAMKVARAHEAAQGVLAL